MKTKDPTPIEALEWIADRLDEYAKSLPEPDRRLFKEKQCVALNTIALALT